MRSAGRLRCGVITKTVERPARKYCMATFTLLASLMACSVARGGEHPGQGAAHHPERQGLRDISISEHATVICHAHEMK